MTARNVQACITDEIRDLHVFFECWFRGELPPTREAFARVERALGPGFWMITPQGELVERASLIESLWMAHASAQGRFEIEVRNVREPVRVAEFPGAVESSGTGRTFVVVYEEWQWRGTRRTSRLSSARLDEARDGSWVWQSVHETWRPGLSGSD